MSEAVDSMDPTLSAEWSTTISTSLLWLVKHKVHLSLVVAVVVFLLCVWTQCYGQLRSFGVLVRSKASVRAYYSSVEDAQHAWHRYALNRPCPLFRPWLLCEKQVELGLVRCSLANLRFDAAAAPPDRPHNVDRFLSRIFNINRPCVG